MRLSNIIRLKHSVKVILRNSTGGTFSFNLSDPITDRVGIVTATIPYPPTVAQIEYAIDMAILPDQKSCGEDVTSYCASTARAWQLGKSDTYFIAFVGERLNAGVSLSLNSADLENYYEEIFLNVTNDAIMKLSDVAYTNIDDLIIHMVSYYTWFLDDVFYYPVVLISISTKGFRGNVVGNIRGSTANHTYIDTLFGDESQSGGDQIFISSDANENHSTALSVEVLYGLLDYIRGELHIELNSGRHRLFVSDCFSEIPKGIGSNGFVEITNSSIINLVSNAVCMFCFNFPCVCWALIPILLIYRVMNLQIFSFLHPTVPG